MGNTTGIEYLKQKADQQNISCSECRRQTVPNVNKDRGVYHCGLHDGERDSDDFCSDFVYDERTIRGTGGKGNEKVW